ncbi:chemotaxis protein, partial [Vibrio splendidus]
VALSNQTSVQLLSADKSFKDFLTTQNAERMSAMRTEFATSQNSFSEVLGSLDAASQNNASLTERIAQLRAMEERYFAEADEAMNNYVAMFEAQEQVQKASRDFQRLHSELTVGMKEYVADQKSISVKVMAKSYFIKLQDAEVITSDALASSDVAFVQKAVNQNKKAVTHLNYAYRGLSTQLPALKNVFDESVQKFTKDVGQKGGVLDKHNNYLKAKEALYINIANLAVEIDQAMAVLDSFNVTAEEQLNASLADASSIYDKGLFNAIAIGIVVTVFAAAIGYHIAHSVREPLTRILSTLEGLTEGDMTQRIDIRYDNEFSRVSRHINTLADNLRNILVKLNDASDDLTKTASVNQKTSTETQDQLNSQREQTATVATAMTEMSHSVQEVANSAQSSLTMVQQVESASESGRQIMNTNISTINQLEVRLTESVGAVGELQQMSSQIGSILDVIRGIAEQTNLLALNAAIEAARAGEQGRGFAVVADQVRELSAKSSHSAIEIRTLLDSSKEEVENGRAIIETTASEMNGIISEVQTISTDVNQLTNIMAMQMNSLKELDLASSEVAQSVAETKSVSSLVANYGSELTDHVTSVKELVASLNSVVSQAKQA